MARVLFVNHTSTVSGAELVLVDVVRAWPSASAFLFEQGPLDAALRARDLDVTVSRWGTAKLSGVRRDSSALRAAPLAGRLAAMTLELAFAARKHDVVYANSQKAFVIAALATGIARRPLIWHLHDIIDGTHFGKGQRRLQIGLANRRAARVIVPSQSAAAAFIAEGGRPDLVAVVPNGLDIAPDPSPRDMLRADLGLPSGPLVGVFSRLAAWKGQHVVLKALAALPQVKGILAGAPLFGEEPYAASLAALTATSGIADRVTFLGPRSDVPRLMRACDIVIHPSVHPEPFGRTLVEAMLSRVPVIATDTGASSEILEGGAAGTLVPPDDPEALAHAMATILAGPPDMDARLDHAVTRARTLYARDRMLADIGGVIDGVIEGART